MTRGDARDAALPFLETVLTPSQMEHFFNERVLPTLFPGRTATRVRRRGLRYEPGQSAVALYSLRSTTNGRSLPERAVVSAFADSHQARLPRKRYAGHTDAQGVFLDDENVLVEFFPTDWRLPGLPAVVDPGQMESTLASVSGPTAGAWQCSVAQYWPNERCVVVYDNGPGQQKVVAKLYVNQRRAARSHAALESFARSSRPAARWQTPRPLAFKAEHAAVWMEHAEGVSLQSLLPTEIDAPFDDDVLVAAARGLAELHASPPPGVRAPERTLASGRAKIRRRTRHVQTLDREVAYGLGWFLEALERGAPAETSTAPRSTVLHGNTRPDQLWLRGEQLTLLDLDAVALGDPALDVGSFLASLVSIQLESRRSEPMLRAGKRFVEIYEKHVPGDDGLARRARRAAAQELVDRAARSFIQRAGERGVPADATRCHLLLEQASHFLDGS